MELKVNLLDPVQVLRGISILSTAHKLIEHGNDEPNAVFAGLGVPVPAVQAEAQPGAPMPPLSDTIINPAEVFKASPLPPPPAGALATAGADLLPTAHATLPLASTAATLPPGPTMNALPPGPGALAPLVPAGPASHASGVELDVNGLPWDERIHSGAKSKTDSGAWRARKGVNDATFIKGVEAELHARAGNVLPVAAPSAIPLPPALPATGAAVASLPSPGGAVGLAPPVTADPVTFEELMLRLTPNIISGAIPPTAANDACVAHGLTNVVALKDVPQHIPQIFTYMKQQYPGLV